MRIFIYLYPENDKKEGLGQFIRKQYNTGLHTIYPSFQIERYNFLSSDGSLTASHMDDAPPPPDYCAIIEGSVHDAELPLFQQQLADPARANEVRALANGWLDSDRTMRVAVDQWTTPSEELESRSVARNAGTMVKQVVNLRKRPDMSDKDFIEYYENAHAPLTVSHLPLFLMYRRNYVVCDDALQRSLNPDIWFAPDFDVTTHIWFESEGMRQRFSDAFGEPEIGQMFSEDSAKLFEAGSMQMFLVDEDVLEGATE